MITKEWSSSKYRNCFASALFLTLVLSSVPAIAMPFDPAAQFSAVANPNGVWSYGFESVPIGSPFNLLPFPSSVPSVPGPAIDSWELPSAGEIALLHNGTAVNQLVSTAIDNALYQPDELAMHPGPNDQYGVVEFAAPANGFYEIEGIFQGIDTTGLTNTDVHLLWNNSRRQRRGDW